MSKTLDITRFRQLADQISDKLIERGEDVVSKLDTEMALTFEEWFQFNQLQAEAFASGRISQQVAQTIYGHLNGESMNIDNGGWSTETDTAEKVLITQLMGELLSLKINRRLAVA